MAFEDFLLTYPSGVPDGTIALTDDGSDWRGVAGAERVAQHVATRLRYRKGEYIFNQSAGINYDNVFKKAPRSSEVNAEYAGQIIDVEGVRAIGTLTVDVDNATRQADVEFSAQTDEGFISGSLAVP